MDNQFGTHRVEHWLQELIPEYVRKKLQPGWLKRVPSYVYEWFVDKLQLFGADERFRAALKTIAEEFLAGALAGAAIGKVLWPMVAIAVCWQRPLSACHTEKIVVPVFSVRVSTAPSSSRSGVEDVIELRPSSCSSAPPLGVVVTPGHAGGSTMTSPRRRCSCMSMPSWNWLTALCGWASALVERACRRSQRHRGAAGDCPASGPGPAGRPVVAALVTMHDSPGLVENRREKRRYAVHLTVTRWRESVV